MAKSTTKKSTTASKSSTAPKVLKNVSSAKRLQQSAILFPTDLGQKASKDISGAMNSVLADVFALYLKTKNFHWHVSGPHFRDYHLMLDDHGEELFAMTDPIAERVRKLGGTTLRSIGHISKLQSISDNNADFVEPSDMLAELCQDNIKLTERMRVAHDICDKYNDTATASLIEEWIDQTERRAWFLFETGRRMDSSGH
ncbi:MULTISPECIES: Dps family protein [unclassified Gilliamella]|uniref:Dps family protein n=1 Tax=unclassified Gilliamella TaxID=2685620 RepID=UPI0009BDC9FD|nr:MULTISPECIES: DNA starvation/stationary phase protection protein [Gilliamella]MCX8582292.1 DNA starvation/stationary phase protection protein [Gilliamella sp. B3482]MCX8582911.1 DNA starvation/stationary phase protection protein [Gilliamella sp. B3372]MCX8586472.1 DNA starvation/stationary phase protection protein [Gilliamella sp. B3562]MCX8595440.1 DNA starvation/stationary phase protection protein [Gilliamella sp. B3367]MCX8596609.1 DNA starvation/stationary phase protection protein [Gill